MTESRRFVLKQTLAILLGEAVGLVLMFIVYVLIGKFGIPVLLGGLVGALLATANFFFMAIIATLAADRAEQQDVAGGEKLIKGSYPIRFLLLAVALILCAKSGFFDIVALALPLVFVRPTLTIQEFFKKKGA